VKVPVIGVGNITEPEYADRIVREQRVDMVAFGRTLLSNPEFPKQAAQKLGVRPYGNNNPVCSRVNNPQSCCVLKCF